MPGVTKNTELLQSIKTKQDTQERRQNHLSGKMDDMDEKLSKVLFYMENDNSTGTIGLVQDCKETKTRVSKLEQKNKEQQAKLGVIAFITFAVANIIGWLTSGWYK